MNYLAHLFLSCDNEDLLIGNFIADSIRNREVANFVPSIQQGIQLHRQIDTFTDQHPMVRQGSRRLQVYHHKYAPVVIDVLYDYLLANNWGKYSGESLDDFSNGVYEILLRRINDLPEKLQRSVPGMVKGNWLQSYGTKDGLLYTFERMDQRTRFPSRFTDAVEHLFEAYEAYDLEFNHFFPQAIAFVESTCKCD